jgi:hypothetical protein
MPAPDDREALLTLLRDALDPEEFEAACAMIDVLVANPGAPATDRKAATDGCSTGVSSMHFVRQWNELQQAERETGVMGQDSAAATYHAAIRQMGHDVPVMPAAGMRTAYALAKRQAAGKPRTMAADAATISARNAMFPNANRLLG